jgi:hypothetical protein
MCSGWYGLRREFFKRMAFRGKMGDMEGDRFFQESYFAFSKNVIIYPTVSIYSSTQELLFLLLP